MKGPASCKKKEVHFVKHAIAISLWHCFICWLSMYMQYALPCIGGRVMSLRRRYAYVLRQSNEKGYFLDCSKQLKARMCECSAVSPTFFPNFQIWYTAAIPCKIIESALKNCILTMHLVNFGKLLGRFCGRVGSSTHGWDVLVSHPSTNRAQHYLNSMIVRELRRLF